MNRSLLSLLGLLAIALPLSSAIAAEPRKPNILLIVADDLGYGELGVQGYTKDIPTPHIDAIAAAGTRFTSGYVSGPYCSPTRAALLTGRYQQRFGHEFNPGPAETAATKVGLDLTQKTFGDRFRAAGYTTAWIGKSHLGYEPEFHPLKRGFDHFFGFLGGAHSYLDSDGKGRDPVQRDGKAVPGIDYLTEDLARDAATFIEQNKGKPWFTYLAFNAVHAPLQATEKYLGRFPNITDPKRQKFAGLLSALDDGVGMVLDKLRETGQEEQTLVFFIADNGGPTPSTSSNNGPLRGFKAQTWEGGVRVAWFVQWKGHLPAGKVDERPVIQIDILPTALAAAGIAPQPDWKLEGTNLLPYIMGENSAAPHESLYWRFGQQMAIRKGDWKLVKAPGGALQPGQLVGTATTENAQLFNLRSDLGEQVNLAAREPGKVKELAAAWDIWNADNIPPKWLPGRHPGQRATKAEAEEPAAKVAKTGPWKSGDTVASAEAPQVGQHGFEVAARVEPAAAEGVIVSLGGRANGFALYVKDAHLAFALRAKGALTNVVSESKLAPGSHAVSARLAADGEITLQVDGQPAGKGKAPTLLPSQPREALMVGTDGHSSVGDYTAPFELSGKIEEVTVKAL